MREKVMDMDLHWERIKKEQLAPLLEVKQDDKNALNPIMSVGGGDPAESMLKGLVQQAARN